MDAAAPTEYRLSAKLLLFQLYEGQPAANPAFLSAAISEPESFAAMYYDVLMEEKVCDRPKFNQKFKDECDSIEILYDAVDEFLINLRDALSTPESGRKATESSEYWRGFKLAQADLELARLLDPERNTVDVICQAEALQAKPVETVGGGPAFAVRVAKTYTGLIGQFDDFTVKGRAAALKSVDAATLSLTSDAEKDAFQVTADMSAGLAWPLFRNSKTYRSAMAVFAETHQIDNNANAKEVDEFTFGAVGNVRFVSDGFAALNRRFDPFEGYHEIYLSPHFTTDREGDAQLGKLEAHWRPPFVNRRLPSKEGFTLDPDLTLRAVTGYAFDGGDSIFFDDSEIAGVGVTGKAALVFDELPTASVFISYSPTYYVAGTDDDFTDLLAFGLKVKLDETEHFTFELSYQNGEVDQKATKIELIKASLGVKF